jgi:transposase
LENAAAIQAGEIVVLMQDECHLLWGDCCGRVWGKRNQTIDVPMRNARQRQTYYGAVNMLTKDIHLKDCEKGDSENPIAYVRYLQELYADKTIWLFWDNASYHRSAALKAFLAQENQGLEKASWKIFCMPFEPHAPEQNPIEDIWLKGKNFLRKNFALNKTFSNVKQCFVNFLTSLRFDSHKFNWYFPQMI